MKKSAVPLPCSPTPAGPTHQAIAMRRRGPRSQHDEGSLQEVISGLDNKALALAVYASQCGSRRPTQDSLLAAGQALPDGIGYPQGSNERFP